MAASISAHKHDDTLLCDALDTLKPYIHALVVMARHLQWKPYRSDRTTTSTMLLVLAFWTTLFFRQQLVLGLAVAYFAAVLPATTATHQRRQQAHSDNNADRHAFINELVELAELTQLLPTVRRTQLARRIDLLAAAAVYLACKWVRLGQLVWLAGFISLVWCSPWVRRLRSIIYARHLAALAAANAAGAAVATAAAPAAPSTSELDRLYCFSVYEHQRWWLHSGWATQMLPHDRPEWSDEYLEPTPSVDQFGLPPRTADCCWEWTDPAWKIDSDGDGDGWEYGSWDWDAWSRKRSYKTFTRRRKWSRCARLVRHPPSPPTPASSPPPPSPIRTDHQHHHTASAADDSDSDSSSSATLLSASPPPSLSFSPKPRPWSLLTHRTLSPVSTVTAHC